MYEIRYCFKIEIGRCTCVMYNWGTSMYSRCCKILTSAGILEQSMGARSRGGIGLSYRPARLHRRAGRCDNSVPTRFLAPIDCSKIPAPSTDYYSPTVLHQFHLLCGLEFRVGFKWNWIASKFNDVQIYSENTLSQGLFAFKYFCGNRKNMCPHKFKRKTEQK
jgi:hypothetical protein